MTIIERLLKYMDYKGLTPNKVTVEANLSVGLIGKSVKKNSGLNSDTIEKILCSYTDLNPEWFVIGTGEMLKTNYKENIPKSNGEKYGEEINKKPNVQKTSTNEEYKRNLIPLYGGVAIGGFNGVANMDSITESEELIDTGGWFTDATAAMHVYGDSMYPEYKSGSIVAMKLINNKQLIVYGQDYVVETDEYRVIKRIQKGEDKSSWTLASVNQEIWESGPLRGRLIHEPFDVELNCVNRVFRVLGVVTRNESSGYIYNNAV
ncbi:S24 family peptidase [Flavobacterium davisii]|nr:S24 family peptidase [Flavobacterium davisii]